MLGERIASQSEVIRAIVSGYSPCCGPSHLARHLERIAECQAGRNAERLGQALMRWTAMVALLAWCHAAGVTEGAGEPSSDRHLVDGELTEVLASDLEKDPETPMFFRLLKCFLYQLLKNDQPAKTAHEDLRSLFCHRSGEG